MKAPDFEYLRPASLEAALTLLADYEGEALPLAGGQSLMPMMNFRAAAPAALIDLADVADLRGITRNDDLIRIGAMTRYVELAELAGELPLIGLALPHIAHDAIRNRGTLGGSLALADAAAEMPAVMLALGASIETAGNGGTRHIAADDFFLGFYETALEPDELITAIHIPCPGPDMRYGFHELTQRHGDYALAGVAIAALSGLREPRIAFFGVADRALRLPALEQALGAGTPLDEALSLLDALPFEGDLKASARTRQRLAGVALKRAIAGMQP